jgi:hypothetical protein
MQCRRFRACFGARAIEEAKMTVPFFDLKAQQAPFANEFTSAMVEATC